MGRCGQGDDLCGNGYWPVAENRVPQQEVMTSGSRPEKIIGLNDGLRQNQGSNDPSSRIYFTLMSG